MRPTQQNTKTPSHATGLFALLGSFLHLKGSGAPSSTRSWTLGLLAIVAVLPTAVAIPVSSAFATGDANMAACPFETESSPGFRSSLPDCRGYELVSPTYGGGDAVEEDSFAPDGEELLALSLSGFSGTEDLEQLAQFGAYYEFSRTPAGWSAEAVDPPVSLFPHHDFKFPSADLSRVLFEVSPPNGGEEQYISPGYSDWDIAVREKAGGGKGRFTVLGPELAPGHEGNDGDFDPSHLAAVVQGASADLSHVFFTVRGEDKQLWPGDETVAGGQSVYEYMLGGSAEPSLVGVSNSGAVVGSPSINDGAMLVSQCGTAFDGVSSGGETVYFTALHVEGCVAGQPKVNELYARVDGSRTVDISEPSSADCGACDTSGVEGAVYQGESEDGSRVFFSTEQRLLAGASGNTLYEFDFDGPAGARVSVVATHVASVASISGDGSHVYFDSPSVIAGSGANANGESAGEVSGEKLYVADTDEVPVVPVFVAGEASQVQATHDGGFAVFGSERDLLGTNDMSTVGQFFEYDALTGVVSRVSVGQQSASGYECPVTGRVEAGFNCDGNTTNPRGEPEFGETRYADQHSGFNGFLGLQSAPGELLHRASVAENGTVVFRSELALTPEAPASHVVSGKATENIYEFRGGQVFLLSAGDEEAPLGSRDTRLVGVDGSGRDVFFLSTDSLVPQDSDSQGSVYDARIEGGFPAPAASVPCSGEACQGAPPGAPAFAAPTSNTLTGSGNLASPIEPKAVVKPAAKPKAKPCKKGFVKKEAKCVRTSKSKKASKLNRGSK